MSKEWAVLLRTVLSSIEYSTYRQEKDRECFYILCPFFLTSTAFVDTNAYSEILCFAKCEIMFCRTLWNISLCSMWNEINPLTPAGISLAESEFHTRSAFHKSLKGFISLRSVLKGTTHMSWIFLCGIEPSAVAVGRLTYGFMENLNKVACARKSALLGNLRNR